MGALTAWQALVDVADTEKNRWAKPFSYMAVRRCGELCHSNAKNTRATVIATASTAIRSLKQSAQDVAVDYTTAQNLKMRQGCEPPCRSRGQESSRVLMA